MDIKFGYDCIYYLKIGYKQAECCKFWKICDQVRLYGPCFQQGKFWIKKE